VFNRTVLAPTLQQAAMVSMNCSVIAAHHPDHVAGRHARLPKPARQRIRAAIHLVERGRALIVDHGDCVRLTNRKRDESHCR